MKKASFIIAAIGCVAAGAVYAVTVSTYVPGTTDTGTPTGFIGGIYNFSLMAAGLLAFGAIVYGGIKYITAAGNPSGQSEGKEWIRGAIYGLLLLFGAYAILNLINPDITTLALPRLAPIPAPPAPSVHLASTCGGSTYGTCQSGICSQVPPGSGKFQCVSGGKKVQMGGCISKVPPIGQVICSSLPITSGCSDINAKCSSSNSCASYGECLIVQ